MRSFKSKVLSACAWAAVPVLASVFPPAPQAPHSQRVEPKADVLELDVHDTYAQATFSVPCANCLGSDHTSHDDESIILSFKAHSFNEPCGTSNITLNGQYLPHEWQGDVASGSASYTGVTDVDANAWLLQHDLDLEWENTCVHGEDESDDAAQILTVNIKAIDGRPTQTPSGFTVSFKQQQHPPELLRLESVPNRSAADKQQAQSWLAPPSELRLRLPPKEDRPSPEHPPSLSLENEISELEALRTEVQKLQEVIDEKETLIKLHIEKETGNLREKLGECDGFKCFVKTIANGAHGAWRIFYIRLKSKHRHNEQPMGKLEDEYHGLRKSHYKQFPAIEGHVRITSDEGSSPPPPSPEQDAHRPRPRMPSPNSPFVIAIEVVLGILCCGCLVTALRSTRCCSLRSRTERAAAREERRNARAYRRAARNHAWRNWWRGNWRDRSRIEDYEEKRSLIQDQENVLEDAMQEEIRQLRAAHGIVNELIGAEEGRSSSSPSSRQRPSHIHCPAPQQPIIPEAPYSPLSATSTYPPTSLPECPSRPLSRTDSLPGYASSSPPAYEEDEDVSDSVANGFRNYVTSPTTSTSSAASSASSRWTPDSSVVDVSPRPSADTLRYAETSYAETTETGVGEKN
ncbi:unnamed protein product [Periconia digitata]|uniref:Uncharacterized protein n=1 Tax=Periconia digitata TaxID=1303443 RepID=A0A9W4U318_9PLEO|nr:unnamed protein product [Periconia digitata]